MCSPCDCRLCVQNYPGFFASRLRADWQHFVSRQNRVFWAERNEKDGTYRVEGTFIGPDGRAVHSVVFVDRFALKYARFDVLKSVRQDVAFQLATFCADEFGRDNLIELEEVERALEKLLPRWESLHARGWWNNARFVSA